MRPLKIALCDDSVAERLFFYNICKSVQKDKDIPMKLKEYETGQALLFDFADSRVRETVDMVLLEINLSGDNGIDVVKKLREDGYQGSIIFITKSEAHWREAFDVKAFNYITKDGDDVKRFTKVLLEAIGEAEVRQSRNLLFSSFGETRQISIAEISNFAVDKYMVTVYYNKEAFEFVSSLSKLESLLIDKDNFIRANRSCVISLSHIEKYDSDAGNVVMKNGAVIPVSTRNAKKLRSLMAEWKAS